MFPRVRTTRSKRPTLKRNQVGGAPAWVSPSPAKYFTNALWTPKLTIPNAENIVKLLTDPTFSNAVSGSYSPEYYTAWLDAIKYQDQIYRAGLEIIIEEITGKPSEQYSEIINKIKTDTLGDSTPLTTMFTHLEHTLSLSHGTNFTAGEPTNKFEHMFRERPVNSEKVLKTEMAHLLLNPKRIENILVQSIAQIIVMLRDPANLKEITDSISNEILKKALINKWVFFTVHGTELQTNEEIRDAFLTGSEPCEVIKDIVPFWTAFVEEIAKPASIDVADFPFQDDHPTYGKLAAGLAKSPTLLDDITKASAPDLSIDYASIPDGIDASPVGGIFKKLAPNLVFFLKHLEGAISSLP